MTRNAKASQPALIWSSLFFSGVSGNLRCAFGAILPFSGDRIQHGSSDRLKDYT